MATVTDPRRRMVRRQIAGRGIADRRVLAAMEKVPREAFLPEAMQEFAYEDTPLPIEEGQTMSQPYIVARMAEAADVSPVDRVLEIGAGSGYAAAVLGELAGRVFTIERHPALADLARARLRQLGYDNVEVRTGDGTLGWPEQAPFDAIIATAGGPRVPDTWRAQLAVERPAGDAGRRDADASAPDPAHAHRPRDLARGGDRGGPLRAADRRAGLVGRA